MERQLKFTFSSRLSTSFNPSNPAQKYPSPIKVRLNQSYSVWRYFQKLVNGWEWRSILGNAGQNTPAAEIRSA